jgi:hypothetical protein
LGPYPEGAEFGVKSSSEYFLALNMYIVMILAIALIVDQDLRAFQPALKVEHTYSAHQLIGVSIELSEAIRIQSVIVEGLKRELSTGRGGLSAAAQDCLERVEQIAAQLNHSENRLSVARQRIQNILDLVCKLLSHMQGGI